ncbi:biotin/lipoyl-containing protein, partial [Deinococcus sp.]|uniref:biotin/lipoyl-containing protein n=1 Tax=Deinococcus sp. TaxID=47478 RepID=UPI002869DC05
MADIKVPVFSESVSEGTLLAWHKQPGEAVKRGELLAEIETDKVVLEIQAQQDGVLQSVVKNEGDTVLSEEVLGTMGDAGSAPAAAPAAAPEAAAPEEPVAASAPATPAPAATEATRRDDLSPAVRKVVAESNLDPASIPATGPKGNITKADAVQAAVQGAQGGA